MKTLNFLLISSKSLQSCPTLFDPMDYCLPGFSVHGDSPGKNIGVSCHALLHEIFPTQGWNPGHPNCTQILYQLSHKGSSRILDWVAYPFSRRSSQPWNWTKVSCIVGGFFTNWAIREAIDTTTVWITINGGKFLKRREYQTIWPISWEICMQVRKHS